MLHTVGHLYQGIREPDDHGEGECFPNMQDEAHPTGESHFDQIYFQVRKFCDFTAVKKPGKLLYCYDRGFTLNVILYVITCIRINKCTLTKECNPVQRKKFPGLVSCCLDQLECVRDWAEMQKHTLGVARLGNTRITV